MESTDIRFEDGLDYGLLRSNSPDVVQRICAQSRVNPDIIIMDMDKGTGDIRAQIPLHLLAKGILFPENKGLRKMAHSGGNGSLFISH